MKILLTGASSYVGARLYFDLKNDFEIIGTYNNYRLSSHFVKLDVTNKSEVGEIIQREKPNLIIHAAANASGNWCKENPEAARAVNEKSTEYIVEAANKIGAKIIFISSFAAITPSDVYGKTKYNSEQAVKKTKKGWVILRPSLILGFSPNTINDRPFNRLLKNIDEGTPAIYDTSWKFQTSYLGHISEVIKIVIKKGIDKEIIPIATEEIKTRLDTAKDILEPLGISVAPTDKHDNAPFVQSNNNKLKELGLPTYTYQQIIEKIIKEIKNREIYKLD